MDKKRYFEQLFPAYLRGTMEKFWEKSIWKLDFRGVLRDFSFKNRRTLVPGLFGLRHFRFRSDHRRGEPGGDVYDYNRAAMTQSGFAGSIYHTVAEE